MIIKTTTANRGFSKLFKKSRESVQKFFNPENNETPTIKFVKLNCVKESLTKSATNKGNLVEDQHVQTRKKKKKF